jgi:indolepyruvate decarboxylase
LISVSDYLVQRFADLGIDQAFGIPGDFPFPLLDPFDASAHIQWVGCANELRDRPLPEAVVE